MATPARKREGLMSELSPAEQREINDRMARYRRIARRDKVKSKAKEFWQSPLPLALVAVGTLVAVSWWRKKKEAESLSAITNP